MTCSFSSSYNFQQLEVQSPNTKSKTSSYQNESVMANLKIIRSATNSLSFCLNLHLFHFSACIEGYHEQFIQNHLKAKCYLMQVNPS